jgi:hypothetical protein
MILPVVAYNIFKNLLIDTPSTYVNCYILILMLLGEKLSNSTDIISI